MEELMKVALDNGIRPGPQLSRFLLWLGNECFEGREVANFLVLAARGRELVRMFLAQDKEPKRGAHESQAL